MSYSVLAWQRTLIIIWKIALSFNDYDTEIVCCFAISPEGVGID